jgi:tRNA modification GTPase
MTDTIFALSSGLPPAGIAVVRISGPSAGKVLALLAGGLPKPRLASFRRFTNPATGDPLDDGLALWFPGPATATGEDLAELHLHGGRAVVAAALACLARQEGLRVAQAGEFTRRAFENGRIDLAQAEGLADLLAAETEGQRRSALVLAEGALGQHVEQWQKLILRESALIEAELDFSDEGDVEDAAPAERSALLALADEMAALLDTPPAERLRDGVRVVLAGPPNAGKSSLFNKLVGRDAAIVTEIAGTTRDRLEAPVTLGGVPLLFVDTAGLRDEGADAVETIGIQRTGQALEEADIILWLGDPDDAPEKALIIAAKADLGKVRPGLGVSVVSGEGITALRVEIVGRAKTLLPREGSLAFNARHRSLLAEVERDLRQASSADDPLIAAEHLRSARGHLDALTGRAGVEDMLDALFGGFCIGK